MPGAAGFARSCEADGIDGHCVAVGRIAPAPQLCTGAMAEKLASQRTEGIAVGQNDEGKLTLIMLCESCGFYQEMYYLSPWRGAKSNVVQIVQYNKRKLDDPCSRTSRPAGYGVHSR